MEVNMDDPSTADGLSKPDDSPASADDDVKQRLKMKVLESRQRVAETDFTSACADAVYPYADGSSTSAASSWSHRQHWEMEHQALPTAGHLNMQSLEPSAVTGSPAQGQSDYSAWVNFPVAYPSPVDGQTAGTVHPDHTQSPQQGVYSQGVHSQGIHNEDVHNPGVHSQGIHNPGIHNPGVHNQDVHSPGVHNSGVQSEVPTKSEGGSPLNADPSLLKPRHEGDNDEEYQVNVYFDVAEKKQDSADEGPVQQHQAAADPGWLEGKAPVVCEPRVKYEPDVQPHSPAPLTPVCRGRGSGRRGRPPSRRARVVRETRRSVAPDSGVGASIASALSSMPFTVVSSAAALTSLVQSYASSGSSLPPMLCSVPVSTSTQPSSSLSLLCTPGTSAVSQTPIITSSGASSYTPNGVVNPGSLAPGASSTPNSAVNPDSSAPGAVAVSLSQGVTGAKGKVSWPQTLSTNTPTTDAFSQMFLGGTSSFLDLSHILAEKFASLVSPASESGAAGRTAGVVDQSSENATQSAGGSHAPSLLPTSADGGSQHPDHQPNTASVTQCSNTESSWAPLTSGSAVLSSQPQTPLNSRASVPTPPQLVVYNVTPLLVLPQALFNSVVASASSSASPPLLPSSRLPPSPQLPPSPPLPVVEDSGDDDDAGEESDDTVVSPWKMPCVKCNETFDSDKDLKKHMQTHTRKPHNCKHCGKQYVNIGHLRNHERAAHTGERTTPADQRTRSRERTRSGAQIRVRDKPFLCKVCNKGFYSSYLLKKHSRLHPSPKHACDVCSTTFSSATDLKNHKKTHVSPSDATGKEILCEQCGQKFNTAKGLENHVCKEKKGQNPDSRTCGTCGKTFQSRVCLQIHVHSTHMDTEECQDLDKNFYTELRQRSKAKRSKKTAVEESDPERFVCPVCGKVLKTLSTLQVHEQVHKKPYNCKTCNKRFSHYFHLNRHQHVHTGVKDFTCEICKKSFISSQTLKLHYTGIHLGDKPYVCDVCNQGFVTKHTLKLHKLKHSDKKPFTCEICGRGFKYECVLKSHRLLHSGSKPYKCDICDKAYVCANYLNKHKRRAHSDPKYTCDVCGKACYFANELKNHKLIHSDDRPYSCDICSKAFHTVLRLRNHKRTHSNEKPYSCSLCDKVFASVGILNSHNRRVHSGKTYDCEVCRKSFKHLESLKDHMNVHLQLKNFVCEECGKDFYSSNALNTHKRLKHTELERSFVCNVCSKSFPFQSYLREHEKTHTKEKTLVCQLCNKAVKYKLSRHMKRVHNYVKPQS